MSSCRQERSTYRVFYVNSYHKGYNPSDEIYNGLREGLDSNNYQLMTFYLDSKRNPSTEFQKAIVADCLSKIKSFRPDILLVSDDNAVLELVEPYFKPGELPVIFCGVNWSAAQYSLPEDHITGMLEVLPLEACIKILKKKYPLAASLTILSEDSFSEKKNTQMTRGIFEKQGMIPRFVFVTDFASWKTRFRAANDSSDLIYLPTNGAISNWNEDSAVAWVKQYIKKPVFTCDDFMMKYSVFGLTKVAREQGEWLSVQTIEVLEHHKKIPDIPVTENTRSVSWINQDLADLIQFNVDRDLRRKSKIIQIK